MDRKDSVVQPLSKTPHDQLAHALRLLSEAGVKIADIQDTIDDSTTRQAVVRAFIGKRVGEAIVAPFLERGVTAKFYVGVFGLDRVYRDHVVDNKLMTPDSIRAILADLSDEERRVMIYEYGLNGMPALDRAEIGSIIGMNSIDVALLILDIHMDIAKIMGLATQ